MPDGPEEYAHEFGLVCEPQRAIGILYLGSGRDEPIPVYPGLTFGLSRAGEGTRTPLEVARRFALVFADPAAWLTDEEVALAYIESDGF